ncbi:acyltransferase family protein [Flindersiella endophytica]
MQPEPNARRTRADVEGLRAIAVGLVLLYHAGLPFLPAGYVGVDVFFVISGFLITGLLTRELDATGRIGLLAFYARRARRLLPSAAVVLLATGIATVVVLPAVRWSEVGGDIASAAGYVVNWRLAGRSVDYLAEDSIVSPVQHFWSLAVEEQFYLLWPLLLLLLAKLFPGGRRGPGRGRAIGLAVIGGGSLAWSVHLSAQQPAVAFFVTTTRLWELAVGAGAALLAAREVRLPPAVAAGVGWVGLAGVAVSAFCFSPLTAWPGYAALLPTLGTAAVILAGSSSPRHGPAVLLGLRPFQFTGRLSYVLYLWHWPMVVFAAAYFGELEPWQGLAVVTLSFVPAWLTHKLVENPVRFHRALVRRPGRALGVGAGLTLAGAATGLLLVAVIAVRQIAPGITPDPLAATKDVPDSYARGCQVNGESAEPVSCTYGDPAGRYDVAVVGDSKVLQWISALDRIGETHGWRIRTYTKSACPFAAATIVDPGDGGPFVSCTKWNRNVLATLLADPPDVVVTSQHKPDALDDPTDPAKGSSPAAMIRGLRDHWTRLTRAGVTIAVVQDNPHPPTASTYSCVDEHRADPDACTFDRAPAERVGAAFSLLTAAKAVPGVSVVDLNDAICEGSRCPAVRDGLLVYRQTSHLTKTFVDRLRPTLERALVPVVERHRHPRF